MKAVILASGKATRLRPYTTNFPKPLMPIGERPILEIVIQRPKQFDQQAGDLVEQLQGRITKPCKPYHPDERASRGIS